MKYFFTSDSHFGHKHIIDVQRQQFKSVEEMNNQLIANWNQIVGQDDIVYHLGDFAYRANSSMIKYVFENLQGTIHLIEGNHGKNLIKVNKNLNRFASISTRLEIQIPDTEVSGGFQWIVLDHYPMISWHGSFRNTWQLHGHSHSALPDIFFHPQRYNVAVELNDYRPLEYNEIKNIMKKQEIRGKSWEVMQIEQQDNTDENI